jgi:NAD(P)-dependent dehydrogenase (short-subunit alcohol dehydrogenase family)
MIEPQFANHVAVVTGAASGIGLAVAKRFAAEGAAVALLDRDEVKGPAASAEIQANGGSCKFFAVDVSQEMAVHFTIGQVLERFHAIDHLVNNAGITLLQKVEDCSVEDWDRVFAVNVRSIFLMVKNALAALRASVHPTIVNVSSVSGIVAQRGTPAYVASKGAVVMLSKALALDLAQDNIRVNCVCPGITDTPMLRSHIQSTSEPARTLRERIYRVPLNRMLSPVEIADAILYLSSNHASGITGTELIIDAGYLAAAEAPID